MNKHSLNNSNFIMDEIESIEFLGEDKSIDISIDDTHMFYANDIYTHNSAEEEEVIKGGKISESYKKGFIADFIVSLSRREEDKLAGTARWYIIKNRYGADALTFPSKMDASIGKIEIYAPTSVKGTEARKDMRNSNELLRKELANRYSDLTNFE